MCNIRSTSSHSAQLPILGLRADLGISVPHESHHASLQQGAVSPRSVVNAHARMTIRVRGGRLAYWARLTARAILGCGLLTIAACGGGGSGYKPPPVAAPNIVTQPQSATVKAGQSATFSVTATGAGTLSYQWSENGTAISGATSSSYIVKSAATSDNGGNFTVAISNDGGTTNSAAASLTVVPYSATSGVAQKGPLVVGSSVTAQELDSALSPTGKQYSYQVSSDLGIFSPTSAFGSQYIALNATGNYFDEIQDQVSDGTITLNGLNDLNAEPVLNVNLLTTLAYQRIQKLVSSGMTFAAAQTQAENEVLAALNIPNGSYYGTFGALDISKGADGDNVLAAVSSLFVYGNNAAALSSLIANFQNDIGTNGTITSPATKSALDAAAAAINPSIIAANLTQKYSSAGVSFDSTQISSWIDQDGSGIVGKFKFQMTKAVATSSFTFPTFVPQSAAGQSVSVTAGQLTDNGTPVGASVTLNATDTLTLSPASSAFGSNGVLTAYLMSGSTKLAKILFISPTADVWLPAGQMVTALTYTSAVTLRNGQVLISGGAGPGDSSVENTFISSSELYDPATNAWTLSGNLVTARYLHTTTVLPNGKVLIAGGIGMGAAYDGNNPTPVAAPIASAELYDPSTGKWSATGNLAQQRAEHTATLLPNGKVLVTGGLASEGVGGGPTASAELYDPTTGKWSSAGTMATARFQHTATLLQNGLVLVAGGMDGLLEFSTAELYDPSTNTWAAAGALTTARTEHTATLLQNGSVLLVGGFDSTGSSMASTDLYNPSTNTFSVGGTLTTARGGHATVLLTSGKVLAAGGENQGTQLASAELYEPSTGHWTPAATMAFARSYFATTTVAGGGVLVLGGWAPGGAHGIILGNAEIYW